MTTLVSSAFRHAAAGLQALQQGTAVLSVIISMDSITQWLCEAGPELMTLPWSPQARSVATAAAVPRVAVVHQLMSWKAALYAALLRLCP